MPPPCLPVSSWGNSACVAFLQDVVLQAEQAVEGKGCLGSRGRPWRGICAGAGDKGVLPDFPHTSHPFRHVQHLITCHRVTTTRSDAHPLLPPHSPQSSHTAAREPSTPQALLLPQGMALTGACSTLSLCPPLPPFPWPSSPAT